MTNEVSSAGGRAGAPESGSRDGEIAALRTELAAMRAEVGALSRRVRELEDTEAIKRLQRAYGYYVDKALWSKVIALFDEACEIEIAGRGVYRGRAGAEIVFRRLVGQLIAKHDYSDGLSRGQLHNHLQLQGIVHVDPDGEHAKGRWRALIQVGVLGKMAHWAEGPYEMEYVKRDGVWRIAVMRWFPTFYTPYEEGWGRTGLPMSAISEEFPPDAPPSHSYQAYPEIFVPPYHYPHPVTGEA